MTENQGYSMKGSTILENGEEITAWDCCDLLNELHSTVIYQRQKIDKLTQKNSELEYENKELKEQVGSDYNDANAMTLKIAELEEELSDVRYDYAMLEVEHSKAKSENEQLKQDIRELQNDKLLTELQMKSDKKQEHIVVLENKIRRMREAIHKLEWLASHRNADLKRENGQLKQFKNEVFKLINAKIKLYSHKPVSAPISQPMSVNFDADMDRLARLSELEALKKELSE